MGAKEFTVILTIKPATSLTEEDVREWLANLFSEMVRNKKLIIESVTEKTP